MLFFSPVLAKEKVPGDAGRKSGWGGEAIFYSRYISRGIAASEGPVFQPSAWVMLNDSLDGHLLPHNGWEPGEDQIAR